MTLEDFFTLTEMKDGLTAPARVEELVAVMQKEKESVLKNASDATRQWSAVGSTLSATEGKACLDLFVQLEGVWFISKWLKDAEAFSIEANDSFLEESISALLQALGKLQLNNEKLTSSGIQDTVKNLLCHKSTMIQDKARTLFNSWNETENDDVIGDTIAKPEVDHDSSIEAQGQRAGEIERVISEEKNGNHVSQPADDDDMPPGFSRGQKLDEVDRVQMKTSENQVSSHVTSDQASVKDGCSDIAAVAEYPSVKAEICPSESKSGPTSDEKSTLLKSESSADDSGQNDKLESLRDRLSKVGVSSSSCVSETRDVSRPEAENAQGTTAEPVASIETTSVVRLEPKASGQGEDFQRIASPDPFVNRSNTFDKASSSEATISKINEAKDAAKAGQRQSRNSCRFTKLTRTKNSVISKTPDMDLEYGTVDALEVARLVAQEVEREIGDYGEQFSSSSSERSSRDDVGEELGSPDSINGEQDLHTNDPVNELPTVENVSAKASPKGDDQVNAGPGNHVQDMDSSQVTDAAREQESNAEKSFSEIDLNQEICSEDGDNLVNPVSNPISVVSASRAAAVPGMPVAPLEFEGALGWKGSAATSAFRPASPRRTADSDRASSGGAASSGLRQRQDFVNIDLNVAEGGENPLLPGLPSGESSVELSSKRSERPKFDLNQMGDDVDVPSDWKAGGIVGPQNGRHSPSPASSSSCLQPSLRNFDLNDRPFSHNHVSDQQIHLADSSSHKVATYRAPADDSVISIFGTKVKKNAFLPQGPFPLSNGRTSEPVMDPSLTRAGTLIGSSPAVPYMHSPVYGYNGLAFRPPVSLSSSMMYRPGGSIPYMVDSRGAHVVPQLMGSAPTVPPPYSQPSFLMNMVGPLPGSHGPSLLRPNLDLNSGFLVDGSSHGPVAQRQFFLPGPVRPMEDRNSGVGPKRKEPDGGWEPFLMNYKHHQPPHL